MLKKKTIKYLNNHCIDLSNKTYIVTGANSGVGYKSVEELIYLNANVIMACRNTSKAIEAKNKLLEDYPNANISIYTLDLASIESIKSFVTTIIENHIDIDGIINNAGVYRLPYQLTKDGYEITMGTNYFGTYLLDQLLVEYFKTLPHEVKLVNTSSISYKFAKTDFDDFYCMKKYKGIKIYARSKLAITRYSIYLANKLEDTNIKVYLNHPGITFTPLMNKAFSKKFIRFANPFRYIFQSNETSALSAPILMGKNFKNGSMVGPSILLGGWGKPKNNKIYKKAYQNIDKLIEFTNKELSKYIEL